MFVRSYDSRETTYSIRADRFHAMRTPLAIPGLEDSDSRKSGCVLNVEILRPYHVRRQLPSAFPAKKSKGIPKRKTNFVSEIKRKARSRNFANKADINT